jgi:hypothetical protein
LHSAFGFEKIAISGAFPILLIGGFEGFMEPLKKGDRVAILPSESSPASDVLEIATVVIAGNIYVQLIDGRMYSSIGGKSLHAKYPSYIVPATAEHMQAIKNRSKCLGHAH